jgi:hypothetical protein
LPFKARSITLTNVERPIGFIDDVEKRCYLPCGDGAIQTKLNEARLKQRSYSDAMMEYQDLFSTFHDMGYECCLIRDM